MRSANSAFNDALAPSGDEDYDRLPADVKVHVTPKEFRWIGEHGRSRLMQDFTEPDYTED